MPEGPVLSEDEKNDRLLAAACYVPFFLINIVAILFVLLGRRGGPFAKFHAIQSVFLLVTYMVVETLLTIPFIFAWVNAVRSIFVSSSAYLEAWSIGMLSIVPVFIFGLGFMLACFVFAFWAYEGKKFKIPILGAQAEKMAG